MPSTTSSYALVDMRMNSHNQTNNGSEQMAVQKNAKVVTAKKTNVEDAAYEPMRSMRTKETG